MQPNKHASRTKSKGGGSFTWEEWELVCAQFDHRCVCCGQRRVLVPDHVAPVVIGGSSDISNIQPLCRACNNKKRAHFIDFRDNPFHGFPPEFQPIIARAPIAASPDVDAPANIKARSDAFQNAAKQLIIDRQVDVTQQSPLRELAYALSVQTGCHYDTAKRHIAKAIRLMRGEISNRQWGGSRPGSGRPKN